MASRSQYFGGAARRNRVGQLYNIFDAALPFGGYNQSGWGREMSAAALQLYTETKTVIVAF